MADDVATDWLYLRLSGCGSEGNPPLSGTGFLVSVLARFVGLSALSSPSQRWKTETCALPESEMPTVRNPGPSLRSHVSGWPAFWGCHYLATST